jgi:hypothetical protein
MNVKELKLKIPSFGLVMDFWTWTTIALEVFNFTKGSDKGFLKI